MPCHRGGTQVADFYRGKIQFFFFCFQKNPKIFGQNTAKTRVLAVFRPKIFGKNWKFSLFFFPCKNPWTPPPKKNLAKPKEETKRTTLEI